MNFRLALALSPLLALVVLTSCGSDDKNPATTSAQNQNGGCPVLNGTYRGSGENGTEVTVKLTTKQEGGTFSYRSGDDDAEFYKADGQETTVKVNGEDTSVSVTCGNNAVVFYTKPKNDPATTVRFTDLGNGQLRGELDDGQPITFNKVPSNPDSTLPVPEPVPPSSAPNADCPVLNGHYASADGSKDLTIATKLDGATYSYRFSDAQEAFLPADGTNHALGQGSYRVACGHDGDQKYVSFDVKRDGAAPLSLELADMGNDTLRLKANGRTTLLQKKNELAQ